MMARTSIQAKIQPTNWHLFPAWHNSFYCFSAYPYEELFNSLLKLYSAIHFSCFGDFSLLMFNSPNQLNSPNLSNNSSHSCWSSAELCRSNTDIVRKPVKLKFCKTQFHERWARSSTRRFQAILIPHSQFPYSVFPEFWSLCCKL